MFLQSPNWLIFYTQVVQGFLFMEKQIFFSLWCRILSTFKGKAAKTSLLQLQVLALISSDRHFWRLMHSSVKFSPFANRRGEKEGRRVTFQCNRSFTKFSSCYLYASVIIKRKYSKPQKRWNIYKNQEGFYSCIFKDLPTQNYNFAAKWALMKKRAKNTVKPPFFFFFFCWLI